MVKYTNKGEEMQKRKTESLLGLLLLFLSVGLVSFQALFHLL